jgi:hypothetical protein
VYAVDKSICMHWCIDEKNIWMCVILMQLVLSFWSCQMLKLSVLLTARSIWHWGVHCIIWFSAKRQVRCDFIINRKASVLTYNGIWEAKTTWNILVCTFWLVTVINLLLIFPSVWHQMTFLVYLWFLR